MVELNDILTKQQNLSRLELHEYFEIIPEKSNDWSTEIQRLYKSKGKNRLYSVKKGKDNITRVIRTQ